LNNLNNGKQKNPVDISRLRDNVEKNQENLQIELLAPAGDLNSLKIAIGNGANSVYFGSNYFNARKKAKNISDEEMEEAIDYAHLHSCRAYLAINTLLLDDEIPLAVDLAEMAYRYGIDAIIIQDIGFAAHLREVLPDLALHASTQATIYDEYAIDACACIGFSRIILPRELSIPEITRLTKYAKTKGIETEVFVHGALCVCYSGQCIMSSMIGGRSGNRGECAQPCRLPYDITVSKRPKNMIAPHLATKDLSAAEHIEELVRAGVTALKIEGRMRSPEYVGEVTNEFNKQIRFVLNKMKFDLFEPSLKGLEKGNTENLLLAFNRGGNFTNHYLTGKKSPDMMAGAHTGSFGVLLGEIAAKNSQIGIIDIRKTPDVVATLFPNKGDVIAIRRKGKDEEIASAPIGSAVVNGLNIRIKGFHPAIIDTMQIGDMVYRMSHSQLAKEALSSDKSKTILSGVLREKEGRIILEWTVSQGITKGISYTEELDPDSLKEKESNPDGLAANGASSGESSAESTVSCISEQRCIEQLSKTGGTPFRIEKIVIESAPAIPVSALNLLRRESLAGISEIIRQSFKRTVPDSTTEDIPDSIRHGLSDSAKDSGTKAVSNNSKSAEFRDYSAVEDIINQIDILAPGKPFLQPDCQMDHPSAESSVHAPDRFSKNLVSAYFYSWDGQAASIACNADWYELPIWAFLKEEALHGLKSLRETEPDARFAVVLPPAIVGPYRTLLMDLVKKLALEGIEAVVSGNPGNAWLCQDIELENFQDSGSNVMNSTTAALLQAFGAASVVPSVELSMEPLAEIVKNVFTDSDCIVELPAYGKLRLMYSEHCPVGYNRSGCKACGSKVPFALKDRKGASFPIICHSETCTVDILNGDNLCAPSEIVELARLGIIRARLYFTDETMEERKALSNGFKKLITNPGMPQIEREIEKIRQTAVDIASAQNHGLTKGHYQRGMH